MEWVSSPTVIDAVRLVKRRPKNTEQQKRENDRMSEGRGSSPVGTRTDDEYDMYTNEEHCAPTQPMEGEKSDDSTESKTAGAAMRSRNDSPDGFTFLRDTLKVKVSPPQSPL